MKKITLIAAIFSIMNIGLLNAQTDQGNYFVGVSSSLNLVGGGSNIMNLSISTVKYKSDSENHNDSESDKITNIDLLPKIGYFVVDNIAVGLDIYISISKENDGGSSSVHSQTLLSAGPFARYYMPTSSFLPFFEVNSTFGNIKSKYDNSDIPDYEGNESKTNLMSIGAGAGLGIPLGERVTFDAFVGYNRLRIKDNGDNEHNASVIVGSLGLKLGFTVFFGAI